MVSSTTHGTRALLTPRWILTTLLVIAAAVGMARLGFWQLDRLAQRRLENRAIEAQISAPVLSLNGELQYGSLNPADLPLMEYRKVTATGVYDPANEILLRNQVHENQPGYHLLTPLRLEGTGAAVLVDRGFIPLDQSTPEDRAPYRVSGPVTVEGMILKARVPRLFGAPDPALGEGETRRDAWNALNLDRIGQQIPYPILPVIVQAAPDRAPDTTYPIAALETVEISEGSHLGYAFQWFTFAALLAVGYPFFIRKQVFGKK